MEEFGESGFKTPYQAAGGEFPESSEAGGDDERTESGEVAREPLLLSGSLSQRKVRSMSTGLKSTWKHVRRGLSNEKHVVADAFIDTKENKPQYLKKEYCNDLLV